MEDNKTILLKGQKLENIPWEERPNEENSVVWRYTKNPIIKRNLLKTSNSIFNSAVVPYNNKFAGVFRCDDQRRYMRIHSGFSDDGINWQIDESPIQLIPTNDEIAELGFNYAYDPRVCWIEDRYYISWCNGYKNSPTIGLAYTHDFKKYYQLENSFLPFNRNGVLFPKKINDMYMMISRPSDTGHTPFGDIYISQSKDLTFWGKHRLVMKAYGDGWQSTKVGAGPVPIETSEGWLLIYHGVLTSCNGFVYSMGVALFDLDEPWKVLYRSEPYILSPQMDYECIGDVPNVVFPCAALTDSATGRIAIYYGAADTVTGLAFTKIDILLDFLKNNSI